MNHPWKKLSFEKSTAGFKSLTPDISELPER
jgi:hypothetical protein